MHELSLLGAGVRPHALNGKAQKTAAQAVTFPIIGMYNASRS